MSDDISAGPYDGIDAALDNALAAVGQARDERAGAVEAGTLPPTALSTNGLWEQAKEIAAAKKTAKADKGKGDKDGDKDEKLGKLDLQGRKRNEQNRGLDEALDKATAKSADKQKARQEERAAAKAEGATPKPKPLSTREFNDPEVVKHRRELRERFGGVKLSARMEQFEKWEEQFKKDPVGTREAIMNAYLKYNPANFAKPKAGKEEEGRGGSIDRAFEGKADLDDLKAYADKYGERLPHLLRQLNDIEKDLIADPVGASARLGANYGAVDAPAQQQPAAHQLPPPASPEEDAQRVRQGVEKIIEHKMLAGLEDDSIAEAIAMVLHHMPRTKDRFADLRTAHSIVVGQQPAAQQASTNGLKSIHGAPSTQAGGGRRRGGGSIDDALTRAFGGI